MAGRPRTRRAERLALGMAVDLRKRGPATIGELLDRQLYGPESWEQMSSAERAAARMAIGRLLTVYGARLDFDGTLCPPRARDGRKRTA